MFTEMEHFNLHKILKFCFVENINFLLLFEVGMKNFAIIKFFHEIKILVPTQLVFPIFLVQIKFSFS